MINVPDHSVFIFANYLMNKLIFHTWMSKCNAWKVKPGAQNGGEQFHGKSFINWAKHILPPPLQSPVGVWCARSEMFSTYNLNMDKAQNSLWRERDTFLHAVGPSWYHTYGVRASRKFFIDYSTVCSRKIRTLKLLWESGFCWNTLYFAETVPKRYCSRLVQLVCFLLLTDTSRI